MKISLMSGVSAKEDINADISGTELAAVSSHSLYVAIKSKLHIGSLGIFAAAPNSCHACIEKNTKAPAAPQTLLPRQAEPNLLAIAGRRFGTLSFTNSSPVLLPSVH